MARNPGTMLSSVERAIQSCKEEQAKLNECIEVYREILFALTPQQKLAPDDSEVASHANKDTTPVEDLEGEHIKMLEDALQKALQVRSSTALSNKDLDRNKKEITAMSKEVTRASAEVKTATKSTCQSASRDGKVQRKPGTSTSSTVGSSSSTNYNHGRSKSNRNTTQSRAGGVRGKKALPAVPHDHRPLDIANIQSKNKTAGSSVLSGDDLGKAAAPTMPLPVSDDTAVHSLPQQKRAPCAQAAMWRSLRIKQNSLWDKVVAVQRKPVPGRSRFMERMTAMFPGDWPSGSPDGTLARVDELTHQMQELQHRRQTAELHIPGGGRERDMKGNKSDQTRERSQMSPAELRDAAAQLKEEWDAWDRWRPEGGPGGDHGGVNVPPLLTITYTAEKELREVERLRMSVALLQQEIDLEQALSDTLSPLLASVGPGGPDPSVIRDVYSLLGEGGQRFPAIVLDS